MTSLEHALSYEYPKPKFPQFVFGVAKGLGKAIVTDPDMFLLATTGVLLGSPSERANGMGYALAGYIVARRIDGIAGHFSQIMIANGRRAAESNPNRG